MTGMRPEKAMAKVQVARIAQALSLFALVAVVALRPLVSESYDSAGNSVTRAVEALADPSPARTLGFDLVILIAACLWLISFALDRAAKYRGTGLEIGLLLLAIAGGLSCYFAGNKRLAINGTVDWLCLPILTLTLVQLLRTRWQQRLILAAILATACVQAAQCYDQYFFTFADSIQRYEAGKEEFWAKQGVDLDSTTVDAFERRLRAWEASGFFAHSNVAGAYLMLCAFAALGVVASRWGVARKFLANHFAFLSLVGAFLFTLAVAGAVFLTGSTGAGISGAIGLALLGVAWWKRAWIAAHRRRVFWLSWIIIIVGIAAVVGHGLYHDSLPGWSLTFRWQYWKASAAMIADHLWTGVGRENFGRHYTLYKDIASPEEVSNPHNFFVQAATEWGIFGLFAVVAMLVGVTRHVAWAAPMREFHVPMEGTAKQTWIAWLVGIGAVIVLGRTMLLGSNDLNYMYYSAATTGIIWVPAFFAFSYSGTNRNESLAQVVSLALAVGLLLFLFQDTISFALFIPASATTFFALLGVWLSERSEGQPSSPVSSGGVGRFLIVALAVGMTFTFCRFVVAPVLKMQYWRDRAEEMRYDDDLVVEEHLATSGAQGTDVLDPTPWVEEARRNFSRNRVMDLVLALRFLSEGQTRDPYNASLRRIESQIHSALAVGTGQREFYLGAVEGAKAALALYPQDPAGLVLLADAEMMAGKELQSKEMLLAAVGHYQEALALDEKRLEWETIQRFRPRVVEEINAKIHAIERRLLEDSYSNPEK